MDDFTDQFLKDFKSTKAVGNADHYPLFMIAPMGRGVSDIRIRIYRDNTDSYPISYAKYFLEITENDNVLETLSFTLNPYIKVTNKFFFGISTIIFNPLNTNIYYRT